MAFVLRRGTSRAKLCLTTACVVASLGLLAVPAVGDAWSQYQSEEVIASVDTACEYETDEAQNLLAEAQRYNNEIAGIADEAPTLAYSEQLSCRGEEAMGWVEIPRINVRLPIYHGADEQALASGIGHVEGTSLPVGGASSNCVLAAHTGMTFARMFDDIGTLEPGDFVIVHVLGAELTYEVEESFVVWPWETDALDIEAGRDLVTLVTCTPYGVNDHRLIVRASRTTREATPDSAAEDLVQSLDAHTLPLVIGVSVTTCTLGIWAATTTIRKKKEEER